MNTKKNVIIWSLYDFANSFVFITFLIYFSKWLVVNNGFSDFWYNATFIIGSIGLVFFAPWLGSKADKIHSGQKYLALSTFGCFLFYTLAIVSAIGGLNLFFTALFFGLGNFFYQLSFVFYNPILKNISTESNRGKISGFGFFANYLGQISGVLISLPFVSGKISLGVDSLIAPLIPATLIFILLALPLIFKKELFKNYENNGSPPNSEISQFKALKIISLVPGVLAFLIAFFLFNDAITTITNNFSIFTSALFKVSDTAISTIILLVIAAAGVGAWGWGFVSDKIGSRKTLIIILSLWAVIIPIISQINQFSILLVFGVIAGLLLGGTSSLSRQILISLVPKEKLNYGFGIYAISERASTFFGPLAWSIVLSFSDYRWAMLSMTIFLVISVFLVRKIPKQTS